MAFLNSLLQRRCGRQHLIGLPKPFVFLVRYDAID